MFTTIGDGALVRLDISDSGVVQVLVGTGATFLSLDNISFRV